MSIAKATAPNLPTNHVQESPEDLLEIQEKEKAWKEGELNRMQSLYSEIMQDKLEKEVLKKNYENTETCASYSLSNNAAWKAEAESFIAWRDSCWQYAIQIEVDVIAGIIPPPSIADFIAGAPKISW